MRSAATMKNSAWGILSQAVACFLSLFSRRVMLETIGVEGVGLNAFLMSVIAMLSLAELGIGTAIVYHMYVPLAENDTDRIVRLMNFYKTVYRAIAVAIVLLGLALLPFMDRIVKDVSYSRGYVSLIFVLFLLQTTSSYLFTYKRSLLSADQKQYIITLYDMGYKIVTVIAGIAVLKLTHELAWYLVLLTVATVAENLLISRRVEKLYPYIKGARERLGRRDILMLAGDVKNVFVGRISAFITQSTDSILINVLVGTVQTGLYSNYNIILGTLSATINQFSSAMRGSIGNLIAREDGAHIERVLERLLFIMFLTGSFCASCLTGLIDPFIDLAFGKGFLLGRVTVYICIFNMYMTAVDIPIWNAISAAGLFSTDKYISIIGSGVNLLVSYILGRRVGMAGILFGTSCTYIIQYTLKTLLFYRRHLERSCVRIMIKSVVYLAAAAAECALAAYLAGKTCMANAYAEFVLKAVVSCIVPVAGCLVFWRTDEFRYAAGLAGQTIKKIYKRFYV